MESTESPSTPIDGKDVFVKTSKGLDEVRTRAFELPSRLRQLLIMIDGRVSTGDLAKRLASIEPDVPGAIVTLLAGGFLAFREARSEESAGASRPEVHEPDFNLEKAKGFARFVILGAMGPAAARRVSRIEEAKTASELRMEIDELRDLLPRVLPKRQAKHVWDQLEPLMTSLGALTPPDR